MISAKVGNYIINKDGHKARIHAICGEIFAVSYLEDFDTCNLWVTFTQAKHWGWRFIEKLEIDDEKEKTQKH